MHNRTLCDKDHDVHLWHHMCQLLSPWIQFIPWNYFSSKSLLIIIHLCKWLVKIVFVCNTLSRMVLCRKVCIILLPYNIILHIYRGQPSSLSPDSVVKYWHLWELLGLKIDLYDFSLSPKMFLTGETLLDWHPCSYLQLVSGTFDHTPTSEKTQMAQYTKLQGPDSKCYSGSSPQHLINLQGWAA